MYGKNVRYTSVRYTVLPVYRTETEMYQLVVGKNNYERN